MSNTNCGVYAIVNIVNNYKYIGSSTNITRRKKEHLLALEKCCHKVQDLQMDWIEYDGKKSIHFMILEHSIEVKDLFKKEAEYINKFDSINKGYNTCLPSELGGTLHDNNTKERLRRIRYVQIFGEFNEEKYLIWIKEFNDKQAKIIHRENNDFTLLTIDRNTGEILHELESPQHTADFLKIDKKRIEEVLSPNTKRPYYKQWTFVRKRDYNPNISYIKTRVKWGTAYEHLLLQTNLVIIDDEQ